MVGGAGHAHILHINTPTHNTRLKKTQAVMSSGILLILAIEL